MVEKTCSPLTLHSKKRRKGDGGGDRRDRGKKIEKRGHRGGR